MTACKKSGPVQQMLNIIKYLDRQIFDPYLVTLYPEPSEGSQLKNFIPYVKHHLAPESKLNLIIGRDHHLRATLEEINPDVIHSLGVFPDFAISRMKRWRHIITLRNYVYEDYPSKYGGLRGSIMAKLHLYAMKHTTKTVTCSESLAKIYNKHLSLKYDFIRNGVDVEKYTKPPKDKKAMIRKELGLSTNAFILVYTGQMIERKNVGFLLSSFANHFKNIDVYLILLGGGNLLDSYKNQYGEIKNIDFRGNVPNVEHYLKACDAYVSTSTSEGLPNGALEAMATGLPVVLSDIDQHKEIFSVDDNIGYCYHQGDEDDFVKGIELVMTNGEEMGNAAYVTAHQQFSANKMSANYQELYKNL